MSVENAAKELRGFLENPAPSAIALTGRWGVGKTYTWRKVLAEYEAANRGNTKPYSAVSLFGIGDLDAVKTSIYTQMKTSEDPTADGLMDKWKSLWQRGRPLTGQSEALPAVLRDWVPDLKPLMFAAIRGWLICIDDLERRPKDLDLQDLLGLVSFLKEERNCKVIVIANDEAFADQGEVFERNFEKVFDLRIAYEPTPREASVIGAPGTSRAAAAVREAVEVLGITNIRVITKIARLAEVVGVALVNSHDDTLRDVARSIALIGWSVYEPELAPPIDFIQNGWVLQGYGLRELNEKDRKWTELLHKVGFKGFGETEELIHAAVAKGHLDQKSLVEFSASMDAKSRRDATRQPFLDVINALNNQWGGDIAAFVTRLGDAMVAAGPSLYITSDINRACQIFEELGRGDLSEKYAQAYVVALPPDDAVLDPARNDEIPQYVETLKKTVLAHRQAQIDTRPVIKFLEDMLGGLSTVAEMERLERLTEDDFYNAFKEYRGSRLQSHLYALRQHHPASVWAAAQSALVRLGANTDLNAYRLRKLGLAPHR